MKSILAAANLGVLERLAHAPSLLAFDFDGTLAPIVARHADARMRPRTAKLLAELCTLYPCVVVSGRSRADVAARVPSDRLRRIVGNHGLELDDLAPSPAPAIIAARRALGQALAPLPGIELEDKGQSLAIHFRASRAPDVAAVITRTVRALRLPLRIVPGKRTINLVPRHAPDKGDAVRLIAADLGAHATLFVGDDVTDEDVFAVRSVVSVRVGRSTTSRAQYFLPRQADVDWLLATLVRLRAGSSRWATSSAPR